MSYCKSMPGAVLPSKRLQKRKRTVLTVDDNGKEKEATILPSPTDLLFPMQHGVSRFPYAVEAVYPAGPIAIPVNKETGAFGTPYLSSQRAIKSAQGKLVPTSMFVNEKYADVSGVIACTSDRSKEPILPLDVVHNHFATVPIPQGLFGSGADEWVTEPDGKQGINLKKVEGKIAATEDS
jgi:hypothetical protein